MCIYFVTFSTLTIISNSFNIMQSTLLSLYISSYHHHIRSIENIVNNIFTRKPNSQGGNHRSLIIIVFQQQLEGGKNPLVTMTSILQLQLEGGYNPLIYRIQPKGSYNSLLLRLQPPFLATSCHPEKRQITIEL